MSYKIVKEEDLHNDGNIHYILEIRRAKKFSELFNKLSPKVQKAAIEKSKQILNEMPLRELR